MNVVNFIRKLAAHPRAGCFLALLLLAGIHEAAAQTAQFFRIAGPAATTITKFRADGTLVWSNALAGTNYTVQTVSSLPGGTNWVDYVQLPVTNSVNTNQIVAFNPPTGMALIPAGSFTMGDIADTNEVGDAAPITIYVSAFYMDQTDVTWALWYQVYDWAITHGYSFDDVVYAGGGRMAQWPDSVCELVYLCEMVQCAKRDARADAGVLHNGGADDHLPDQRPGPHQFLCELAGGLPVADGSGMGEGGAGRIERAAVSVGGHDQWKPGQLL
jgi:hypothetical protein